MTWKNRAAREIAIGGNAIVRRQFIGDVFYDRIEQAVFMRDVIVPRRLIQRPRMHFRRDIGMPRAQRRLALSVVNPHPAYARDYQKNDDREPLHPSENACFHFEFQRYAPELSSLLPD
ncbi:hypothetical protein [Paraburkholderia adhaesiva]|uniref:hypothetical protein n=1 Tax=Paraburkholderia adhaesiva TaxID=2883244 RepID=UPI001F40C5AF|nr:hypothetical protein [Paraburkholderia adhaesiva]